MAPLRRPWRVLWLASCFGLLAGPAAADRFWQYDALVDRYQQGHHGEAVLALNEWRGHDLEQVVELAVRRRWTKLRAAALLHADRAVLEAPGRAQDGENLHLDLALRLVRALPPATQAFRARLLLAMALAWQRTEDWAVSLKLLREGHEQSPKDAGLLLALGSIEETYAGFSNRQGLPAAIPDRRQRLARMGETSYVRGQLQSAEQHLRGALAARGDLHEARLRLARVLTRLGRLDESLAELDLLLARSQASDQLYLGHLELGRIRERQGRLAEAASAYAAAVLQDPRCQTAQLALSHARLRLGDGEGAQAALRLALAHGGASRGYADAWWLYPLGQRDQADALFEELRRELRP